MSVRASKVTTMVLFVALADIATPSQAQTDFTGQ